MDAGPALVDSFHGYFMGITNINEHKDWGRSWVTNNVVAIGTFGDTAGVCYVLDFTTVGFWQFESPTGF